MQSQKSLHQNAVELLNPVAIHPNMAAFVGMCLDLSTVSILTVFAGKRSPAEAIVAERTAELEGEKQKVEDLSKKIIKDLKLTPAPNVQPKAFADTGRSGSASDRLGPDIYSTAHHSLKHIFFNMFL